MLGLRSFTRSITMMRVLRKAGRLAMADEPDEALARLSTVARITDDDYGSERLAPKLAAYLDGLPDELSTTYVLMLSGALGMRRRTREALHVVEAFLGLERGDYADPAGLTRKLHLRLNPMAADLRASLVCTLFGSLGVLSRESESSALLGADLNLDPAAADRTADFEAKLIARLSGLSPDAALMYFNVVGMSLDGLGVGSAGVTALERYLDLRSADYESPERLAAKLQPWLGSLGSPITGLIALAGLAALLAEADAEERALALLEWYVGVEPADYQDPRELGRKWRTFCADHPEDIGPTTWRIWGGVLSGAGRFDDALALIEADSGLRLADLDDPGRFGPKLEHRLAQAQVDTRAAYLFSLVDDLTRIGHPDPATLIAEWFLRGYENFWRVPSAGDPGVVHVIPLLVRWLEAASLARPDLAWRFCEQGVLYLRHSLVMTEMQLADRREFIRYVERLRREVLQVGDRWSGQGPLSPADEAHALQAQLWDAELGQRLLFEGFLIASIEPIPRADAPEDRWPLAAAEPADLGTHLPDPAACREEDMFRLLRWRAARPAPAPPDPAVRAGDPAAEGWLREAESIVRGGVTESVLAATLGANGLLVRAGFRADQALVWAALRRRDGDDGVRVVAAGTGAPGDLWRLRWASFRHDMRLLMAATPLRLEVEGRVLSPAEMLIEVLAEALGTMTAALDRAAAADGAAADWLTGITPVLAELDGPKSTIAADEQLGSRLHTLLTGASPFTERDWLNATRTELGRLAAIVTRYRETRFASARAALDEIDDVTRSYLADVAEIWSLDQLTDRLRADDDLVFQLEDSLQSVPIAHYPLHGGAALHTRVRSTRISLSVLMTIMQGQLEESFETTADRILALSYFEPSLDAEDAASYAKWLHHGQRWLARRSAADPMTCLNAAEAPVGAAGSMRAALEAYQGFQTVTVCGHGSADGAGIELSDGLWQGDGCDWRAVNLLILVSCSVGRLTQTEDQDVEGLCVRLALHRARAVLACRWPVIAPQAIAFANEVVAQYLALRQEPGDATRANLRARAVNAARRRFLKADGTRMEDEIVRLNTVAAFELYGLG
ncbi:hypothetical protein GCM10009555_058900 [Acrocarpospora macrocephala]|uniref:CHAT domain-containing protein n=1 Tax=Acrocarpospora macrocephala TaxID=150177 RepID=A0A5M3WRD9_9ACTN|nr:hypothetical protein [Acrocarpospora macrocephala]GES11885.1 hypothetical protein Amac_054820 [Acrocarpospora macrocephala]